MFLGKYAITSHAVEQYEKRIHNKRYRDIKTCIRNDLRTLNIRKIVSYKNEAHIFTKGFKEFIFTVENRDGKKFYILNTVIRRDMKSTVESISKHERLKKKYEMLGG